MSDHEHPARPWYDVVTERRAVKGWSLHELARRSGVGRPTINRWRDGNEVPQPGPVGRVADALGISRERAVRLAGIVSAGQGQEPRGRKPMSAELQAKMRAELGDERAARLIAHDAHLASGRTAPAEDAPSPESGPTDRRTVG